MCSIGFDGPRTSTIGKTIRWKKHDLNKQSQQFGYPCTPESTIGTIKNSWLNWNSGVLTFEEKSFYFLGLVFLRS